MAQIKTMAGIASISGRIGNYCFRTMKSTGKVYMHQAPSKKSKAAPKMPTTAQELQKRRFATIAKMVMQMMAGGSSKTKKQLWKIASEAYDAANQL